MRIAAEYGAGAQERARGEFLNPYNLTELRRGYNKIDLGIVFDVAGNQISGSCKRSTEEHFVIGIGKVRS